MATTNLKEIAREFEVLLGLDSSQIDYSLHVNPSQGVGFFPLNEATSKAMGEMPMKKYWFVLDKLADVANGFGEGESMDIKRRAIYC